MKIKNATFLTLILMPLFLLGACEQQTSSSSSDASRINFGPNVHDKTFGNYMIHINALTTDQLPTEVARGYNISRSKNRAMLNISVREKQADGQTQSPVTAEISLIVKNLSNQLKNVKLREIKEDDPVAIYYIGELPVSNEETIVFDLDVTPAGSSETILLSYRQQFFTK